MISISNHGPLITASNYWGGQIEAAGKIFISSNAGCFRILLPRALVGEVSDMRTGKLVIVSRGLLQPGLEGLEFLFEDHTDSPYSLSVSSGQVDRFPLPEDAGRDWICSVWIDRRGRPHKVLEKVARYRVVTQLPCLEEWR